MQNDHFHGEGLYTKADGSGYQGEFKAGVRHGKGTAFSSTGRVIHQGMYANMKFNGPGKYFYENGDTYEGEFVDGKFHGQGKYTSVEADGAVMEGKFENGKFADQAAT